MIPFYMSDIHKFLDGAWNDSHCIVLDLHLHNPRPFLLLAFACLCQLHVECHELYASVLLSACVLWLMPAVTVSCLCA